MAFKVSKKGPSFWPRIKRVKANAMDLAQAEKRLRRFDHLNLKGLAYDSRVYLKHYAGVSDINPLMERHTFLSVTDFGQGVTFTGTITIYRVQQARDLVCTFLHPGLLRGSRLGGTLLSLILLRGGVHEGYNFAISRPADCSQKMAEKMRVFHPKFFRFPDFSGGVYTEKVSMTVPAITGRERDAIEWYWGRFLVPRSRV